MGRVQAALITESFSKNTVLVQIARFKILALIDTGAYYSIVSEQFFKRLALPLRRLETNEYQKLCLADGKPVDLLGKVEITIKINGLSIPFECRVLPNLAYDLILGLDFLESTKAQIDFKERILTLYDNMTAASFTTFRKEPNILFPKRPTVLPPHSEILVPMSVPKHITPQLCLIEPLKSQSRQQFLLARSLVYTFPSATMCRVLNPTGRVIWLSPRRPLASIEPVSQNDIFDEPSSFPVHATTDTLMSLNMNHPNTPPSSTLFSSFPAEMNHSTNDLVNNSATAALHNLGLKYHSD